MVDFILFSFSIAMFAGGFWCGKKYGSFTNMTNAAKTRVKSWL